jgi:hypothetical protein
MSPDALPASLLAVGAILLVSCAAGVAAASALVPGRWRDPERWGWGIAVASLLLALDAVVSLALPALRGWPAGILVAALAIVAARRFRLPTAERERSPWSLAAWALLALTAVGVAIYLVRSLAEPMWSNDYLAIWGLKAKAIQESGSIPPWLFRSPEFQFSNPSYPIGLPLAYAGVAALLGHWEDHAMALLFPLWLIGTLGVVVGFLRRRGASWPLALAASAFVAHFGLLYSAWLTGMAEVPLAFAILLLGTAVWDFLDETDPGALRRLVLASLLAAATKNEGRFALMTAVVMVAFVAWRRRSGRLWLGAAAVAVAGALLWGIHAMVLGRHPERAIDPSMLWQPGLGARVAATLRDEWRLLVSPIWPGIAAAALLLILAPRDRANPALVLAGVTLAVYLALPVICPFGPEWLVRWTVGRISAALVPLLAAGIAMAWRGPGRLPGPAMAAVRAS